MQLQGIKQSASPFLTWKKNWDEDEDIKIQISQEIKKGITEALNFQRPSHI